MDRNLEPEYLKKLIKVHTAQHSIDIYNEFVHNYKNKHLGEIINNRDPQATNEWYQKRGQVFARFVQRYYLREEKNGR